MEVNLNTIIEWVEKDNDLRFKTERVLWMDVQVIVVIPLEDKNALPILRNHDDVLRALEEGEAIKRPIDPYLSVIVPGEKYLEKHRKRRDIAWKVIQEIVDEEPAIYDSNRRGFLVSLMVEKFGVQKKTVYKYLRKYWKGGKTKNALLPEFRKSGGPGNRRRPKDKKLGRPSLLSKRDPEKEGVNITKEMAARLKRYGKYYYFSGRYPTYGKAYEAMVADHFAIGYHYVGDVRVPELPPKWEYPTLGQFKYHIEPKEDLKGKLISREGKIKFAQNHRAIIGDSTQMAKGPGHMFMIDATMADVYLVSSFDRSRVLKRPVLYNVVDVYSRLMVGFYIGFEGAGWAGAISALENMCEDKVKFCADYGIEISPDEWPSHHLPQQLMTDNGEFKAKLSDQLSDKLNVIALTDPAYRPDWKGIVEQKFRQLNLGVIHLLPGTTEGKPRERGTKDYRLDAVLTLQEFTEIIIYAIREYNNFYFVKDYQRDLQMIEDNVNPIPVELWNWGVKHAKGRLREASPDFVKSALMKRGQGTVTPSGIDFDGMSFYSEKAMEEQWHEQARIYGTWKVNVSYDPRSTNEINILASDDSLVDVAKLKKSQSRYKDKHFEEVEALLEDEKVNYKLHESKEMQGKAERDAHVKSIVQKAKEKTNEAMKNGVTGRRRLENMRENTTEERERMQQTQALGVSSNEASRETFDTELIKDPLQNKDGNESIRPKSYNQLLRGQQGKK